MMAARRRRSPVELQVKKGCLTCAGVITVNDKLLLKEIGLLENFSLKKSVLQEDHEGFLAESCLR